MKTSKIVFIAALVLTLCVFIGLVSAFDSNSLSAFPVFSKPALNVGGTVTVRITVQSNVDEQLQISHVGVNFDWMSSSGFYGPDLSSNPAVVPNNGSYTTPPFIVQIPTNVTVGTHTYFVGVDGIESSNQNEFFWNSTVAAIQVLPANTTGTTTYPTTSPTGGGGGQTTSSISPLTLIIYIAVAAIVVVVILALIVMVVQKRRKTKSTTQAPDATAADQPKKSDEEQNKKEEKDSFDAQI